ncbi:MAG: methyltransferase domain-containing protein, partial [Deltaproteobacteria bacterium]|nr:methyltransferase domain-containing protein [Deltaproteobacteria bacterium]
REASADAIPFESASFDAVVSQFGLMFFPDKPLAIREMLRVSAVCGSSARVLGFVPPSCSE